MSKTSVQTAWLTFKAKMNADDDTYYDPEQRPYVYDDTGADKDRVKREGAGQRLNSTLPPPPSEGLV